MPTLSTEDLLDSTQVAELLGLAHRNSVTTYLKRYPDFPVPVVERAGGRIRLWWRKDVTAWQHLERSGVAAPSSNAEQRERIVTAAHRLMGQQPTREISIRRIADEAGLPHAVIYRHVRSKQELHRLVVDHAISEIWGSVSDSGDGSWRSYLPAVVEQMLNHPISVKVFVLAILEGDDLREYKHPTVMARMFGALSEDPQYRGSGEFSAETVVAAAAALLIGAIVFERRISDALRPEVLTQESLTAITSALFELTLDAPAPIA